ncbi:MAG: FtsX-like permease family protein [Prevotellaceae bacterium]|jgi:lipoprotein-releasing system permease protein|nr:FtsX-like permease family protein [Prevotellaceae bacterium]
MRFPLYIARRYLLSRKKHRAVNVISAVSIAGVAFATLALVCTLSVYNGLQSFVSDLFTAFDPPLKVLPVYGKVFDTNDPRVQAVMKLPEIAVCTPTLEENAMLRYRDRQAVVTLKGVADNFRELVSIDSVLFGGDDFVWQDSLVHYGLMGIELVPILGTGVRFVEPLTVYAPKRHEPVNLNNPVTSFVEDYLYSPGVVFAVKQEKYDAHYILTSLSFARRLFQYDTEASAIELKLRPNADLPTVKQQIRNLLGTDFQVLDRYEQQASIFHFMEIEKLVSYLFLTFILLIACFNVIGSLSMLMVDKQEDVRTLRSMGADNRLVRRIFFFEGCLISFFGAIIGIVSGVALCLLQQRFGLLKLASGLIDAYPVRIEIGDVCLVFVTVLLIGVLAVWWPVHYLSRSIKRLA